MAYRTFDNPEFSRRSLFRGGGYVAAGAALSTLPFGRSAFAHDVSQSWPTVAALADKYVSERKVANLFLTFGWGQEDHAHTVGGGTLSLGGSTVVDENSLYRIYSMTKPITGMAIMMLIEDGLLSMDQPLHDVMPAFKDMRVLVDREGALDDTVPVKTPITMRHLLTHTAGLGYLITSKGPLLDAYRENGLVGGRVSRIPIPGIPVVEPAPNLEVWADRLATLPLEFQPATKWSYSCSIDLLGRVIEVASGKDFETFLKERIFEPCGMDSTWMTVPKSEISRMTDNYGILGSMPLPIDPAVATIYTDAPKVPSGGGGLVSSPKDYDRFLRMLLGYGMLGNERVMAEETVRVGVSNLIPETVDLTGSWMVGQGHGAGGRSINGTFGWGGAAGTIAAVDYKLGLRSALWTQYMPTEAFPIRDEFLAALEVDLTAMRADKAA
ncbi:serine hydrolase domain-containing protein [Erythrobacter sp. F6033]|uniref:serine hydrolase domain-containing protein n=1 Tax=Erythrobacter sp. F6033 TaxID=2926401 RepID=UPI001FF3263C|nr:serine hydrolase domain-containing protein [Erythrobacter sp. F6033]MCK0127919.1 beta-lactamase family protein [Erythrobacter sp. F6033]